MNKIFLVPVLVVLASILFFGCVEQPGNPPAGNANTGAFLLAVKDKTIDSAFLGGVRLTISNVSIHSQNGDSWLVLSDEIKEFDLLELQDVQALLANKDLNAGAYNQIRLSIDKVLVDYNGTTSEAKLPSKVLKLNVQIEIDANRISVAILDFDLNKSLHSTGNDQIIMLPVIKIVSEKNAEASVDSEGNVRITRNGTKTQDSEIGTDLEGNTGPGNQIESEKELEIDDTGKIKETENQGNGSEPNGTVPGQGRLVGTIKDKPLKQGRIDASEIRELNITISRITIHRPNSTDENTESWIEILNIPTTFNLMDLQETEQLIGDLNVAIGSFTQIRLDINSAIAVIDENSDDTNTETFTVKIPSNKLKLTSKITVDENQTSYFNLDFDLNKSLHVTGNNQIMLKPVIKLISKKNVEVQEQESGKIKVVGGITEQESETTFDENGNTTA